MRPGRAGSPAERKKAMARGVLMHRLLQSLPDIPRAARTEAALRHLARAAGDFSAEEQESLLAQVRRVLEDARFSRAVFTREPRRGPDRRAASRAEPLLSPARSTDLPSSPMRS